jgi:tripartite-type tricarboxylate transporter receptor subunit TctC
MKIGAFVATALLLPLMAYSQTFPSKPLRIIVPVGQGSSVDLFPRLLAPKLGEGFGQQVIVENRVGGSGIPAMEYLAHSAPDGYTIMHGTTSNLISVVFLIKNLPYDPFKDFTPIAAAIEPVDFVMIRSSLPVASLREFVEMAKRNPGKFSFGSGGTGAYHHLVGEAIQMATGIKLLHVPYKSIAQAGPELIADRIDMTFGTLPGTRPFTSTGKARVIAYLGKDRYPGLPDVPGVGEIYPSFTKPPAWFAFWGPPGMPQAITSRWNSEIVKAMHAPEIRKWFDENGVVVYASTPQRLTEMMKESTEVYRTIINAVGIKPE